MEHGLAGLRRHQTAAFVVLTLALSWGWWAFVDAVLTSGTPSQLSLVPGAFGPPVAAALVTWASGGDLREWAAGVVDWKVPARWYLLVTVLPVAVIAGGVTVGLALAGGPIDASVLVRRLPTYAVGLVFVLLVGGGQEEPGWRGFAVPRLQATHGPLVASLAVGGVWALWHLPLFYMGLPRNASGSFLLYAVLVAGLSVLLTWCYSETGGSVLLAMLFHAGVNAASGLVPLGREAVSQWGLVVDVSMAAAVWLGALAVVVRWTTAPSVRDSRHAIGRRDGSEE